MRNWLCWVQVWLVSGVAACTGMDSGSGMDAGMEGDGQNVCIVGATRVLISEVVTAPVSDWSHSDSNGAPFNGTPGTGLVSTDDEFIEIYNAGDCPVDLSNWTLAINDDDPSEGLLGVIGTFVPGAGSTLGALQPGSYAVIGNPQDTMSNDVYIVLRDEAGNVIDDVEIGGFTASRDTEKDGIDDGAPGPDQNGFARGMFEEAIARPDGQPDTDVDRADFIKLPATPLAPNKPPSRPDEKVAPTIVGPPHTMRDYRLTEPVQIEFSEPVDALTVAQNVTVTASGGSVPLGYFTFEDRDTTMILNPIGRLPPGETLQVKLRGGASGITDLAGNPLKNDITFSITTEPAPSNPGAVVINEVCISPVQDWSDSSGGDRIPFSGTPGTGAVNSQDEWIELLVRGSSTINLRPYSIVVYNGPNLLTPTFESTPLSASGGTVIRLVGDGTLDAARPGDRVIIGNPRGAFLLDTYIELRDGSGVLVDSVEIGGNSPETDRGGNGIRNGAPDPGKNGSSTGLSDETIARLLDGNDTGNDVDDFASTTASPGAANMP